MLDQLINYRFDILHYCGHCFFNPEDPSRSGWLFNREPRHILTAHELSRIDRVPRFVFSNACESGVTPDRASARSALLAPSFAEAFFARGVSNFMWRGRWTMRPLLVSRAAFTTVCLGFLHWGGGRNRPTRPWPPRVRKSRQPIRAWRRPNLGRTALRRPEFSYHCGDKAGRKPKEGGKASQENRRVTNVREPYSSPTKSPRLVSLRTHVSNCRPWSGRISPKFARTARYLGACFKASRALSVSSQSQQRSNEAYRLPRRR